MKNRIIIMLFLAVIIFNAAACEAVTKNEGKTGDEAMVRSISPQDAKKVLETAANVILLDVRTAEENYEKHIPGSVLLPLAELPKKAEVILKDKEAQILVYCRSGNRSRTAAAMLDRLGYKNVYNLGGIISWPYETESGK
ncbi:MAG: rhodanese-like domain-containing protein [Bacillota bacterium]